ncbi:MAG: hypothetical protein GZ093_17430 [Rhodoferax sp.]|nr:hypothetical protein [Rhodoferax sp.]
MHINYLRCKPMKTVTATFPPLESVTRPAVDTAAAAYYLNRKQQTLRGWACLENGPLRPIRISGRLAWPTQKIRELLGVAPA